ncbi:MAG: glutamine amidotransferase [Deltaproteobacteria bacterium]|nr:glutamine amidotransferase [Deltaproteobacteria bacterium]
MTETRKSWLIVKMGSTFPALKERLGDFEDWILAGMGVPRQQAEVVHPPAGDPLPDPEGFAGIVMTGSHAMVSDRERWSESLAPWLQRVAAQGVPFLGICYGHQLLGRALGGEVADHPCGPEVGTVRVTLRREASADPLFGQLPETFPAQVTHGQSVLQLPPGALLLASSDHEPHQAFRVGKAAWGVQFHPEFSVAATRFYVEALADRLRAWGCDPERLRSSVCDTPEAAGLLRRFTALASRR